jgi:hypothetical protein
MSTAIRRALFGKMSGDTTLNNLLHAPPAGYTKSIFYQEAPNKAGLPYVIFNQQSGTPAYGFASTTVMDNEIWLIKGVDRNESADTADSIAERLDALLTDGVLSISGKTQLYLRRESDLPSYSETVDGVRYIHSGALFRLITV